MLLYPGLHPGLQICHPYRDFSDPYSQCCLWQKNKVDAGSLQEGIADCVGIYPTLKESFIGSSALAGAEYIHLFFAITENFGLKNVQQCVKKSQGSQNFATFEKG
jgi:hypothetical protein